MKKTVYTYYDNLAQPDRELELLYLGMKSWQLRGWRTEIFGPILARQHPLYLELLSKIGRFPTVNPWAYEHACYLRWLCADLVGEPAMYIDYDTFNLRYTSDQADYTRSTMLSDPEIGACPPYWMLPQDASRMVRMFLDHDPNDTHLINGQPHLSDLFVFEKHDCLGFAVDTRQKLYWQDPAADSEIVHLNNDSCARLGVDRVTTAKDIVNGW